MAYHSAEFDSALAIAAGQDAALKAELRAAFAASLAQQIDLFRRARCDANWYQTADRLHGLAASFHVTELMALAQVARESAPGEPAVLRQLSEFASDFGALSHN